MNLSRAIDGDLPAAERAALIDAVLTDPELAQRWKRYQAIGELMREGALGVDLTARVRAQVDADPAMETAGGTVVQLAREVRRRKWTSPPTFGLALAASVAVGTVVGLRVLLPDPAQGPTVAVVAPDAAGPAQTLLEGVVPAGFPESTQVGSAERGLAGPETEVGPAGRLLMPGSDSGLANEAEAETDAAAAMPQARLADYMERHQRRTHTATLVSVEQAPAGEARR